MSHLNSEWTILEKLLLTQAVYKYGENMWFQVARVLKQHGLIQQQELHRQSDFYSQKNCSFQYYLLVESIEAEKQILRNDLRNDMPVVVRLARQLYAQRVEEIKSRIQKEQEEFGQLSFEIDSIKSGKWDERLKEQASLTEKEDQPVGNEDGTVEKEVTPTPTKVNDEVENLINKVSVVIEQESRLKRRVSESGLRMHHEFKRSRVDDTAIDHDLTNEDEVVSTAICEIKKNTNAVQSNSQKTVIDVDVDHITTSEQDMTKDTIAKDLEKQVIVSNTETLIVARSSTATTEINILPTAEQKDDITATEEDTPDEITSTIKEESQPLHLPKIIIPEQVSAHLVSQQDQLASPISKLNIQTPEDENFTRSETATPTSKRSSQQTNSDQRQKAWQKNINLLWQEIANHKNGTMFMNPIKKSYAPLYDEVVKQPLYLRTIKNRVRDGIVRTTTEFERDIVLMLTNSLMYNKEGTEMYLMALEMLDDVREQIRLFKSADSYSMSFWESEQ